MQQNMTLPGLPHPAALPAKSSVSPEPPPVLGNGRRDRAADGGFADRLTALGGRAGSSSTPRAATPDGSDDMAPTPVVSTGNDSGKILPLTGKDAAQDAANGEFEAFELSDSAILAALIAPALPQPAQAPELKPTPPAGPSAATPPPLAQLTPSAPPTLPVSQDALRAGQSAAVAGDGIAVSLALQPSRDKGAGRPTLASRAQPAPGDAGTAPSSAASSLTSGDGLPVAQARAMAGLGNNAGHELPDGRARSESPANFQAESAQLVERSGSMPPAPSGHPLAADWQTGQRSDAGLPAGPTAPARFDPAEAVAKVVERLFEARTFAHQSSVRISLDHADFGPLELTFSQVGRSLDVAVSAGDGDAQVALAAALQTADRGPQRDNSHPGSNAQGAAQGQRAGDTGTGTGSGTGSGTGNGLRDGQGQSTFGDSDRRRAPAPANTLPPADTISPRPSPGRDGIYA